MKNIRWQLTIQFVTLTVFVYVILTGIGLLLCYVELNDAMDNQLDALLYEVAKQIDCDETGFTWRVPKSKIQSPPFALPASFQLFDSRGRLVDQRGSQGYAVLLKNVREIQGGHFRSKYVPLIDNAQTVGYLQIQLPTLARDRSMQKFGVSMGGVTLIGLIFFGFAGFMFARKATQPLITSYEMLKQFSDDAAHELNTPISTVRAAAENMGEELDDPKSLSVRLDVINRSVERMNRIVKDLMLLTKLGLEAEQPSREPEQVQFGKLVQDVVAEFVDRFKQRGIELSTILEITPTLDGYTDSLHRMVANLLENALRYTEPGGKVSIALTAAGNHAKVTVTDTGIGIPEESVNKIFDRFYRVDKARAREMGGSGLGLSIVKAIAEMHGASVSVQSQAGQGSTFTIVLPLHQK